MRKTRFLSLLLLLSLLCTACGAKTPEAADGNPNPAGSTEPENGRADDKDPAGSTEPENGRADDKDPAGGDTAEDSGQGDYVLLTQVAQMDDGRLLTLDAYGRKLDNDYGVREVRVYDKGELIQTISVREAIEKEWSFSEGVVRDEFYDYTSCWSPEETLSVLDLNFDGSSDFALFGWSPNNTIPYYCWQWDKDAGQYHYIGILQGVKSHPETGEVISEYKSGDGGSEYAYDHYQPDEDGNLQLVRHEVSILSQVAENQDTERPVWETWIPEEGAVIRPAGWDGRGLVLVRREIPVQEIGADGTLAYFTEIWEAGEDGDLQLSSREEFSYET